MLAERRHPAPVDEGPPVAVVVAGAVLVLGLVALTLGQHHPGASPHVPWWVLAGLFLAAEAGPLAAVRDRAAVTSPTSRVVLVVGLYLAGPLELVAAHALGRFLAASPGLRRQPARVGWLVVAATLSTAVGAWAYGAVTGPTAPRGPEGWADGIVATALAVACSTVLGAAVVAARAPHRELGPWVARTLVGDVLAGATGLVAVEVLRTDPYAAWLLLLPAVAAYAVRHQYELAGWRADALGSLHALARRLQRATDRDQAIALAVREAREVCRAGVATIVAPGGAGLLRWSGGGTGAAPATAAERACLASLSAASGAVVTSTSTLARTGPWPARARRSLVVPLLLGGAVHGCLVLQRSGRRPFSGLEVQVAETLVTSLGVALETIANHEDLAERNHHNALLLAQQELVTAELERVSDAKSVFLTTTSHELRAPLGALLAQTELLDRLLPRAPGGAVCRELVRGTRSDAQHLLRLVDDLLDLSRIEAGRLELLCEPTDLRSVAEAVVASLRSTLDGDPDRLTIGGAARAVLDADRVRLRQVVTNLVHNALRATEEGGQVHVEVGAGDGLVELAVVDTGCGIAADDLARMFDPFERCRRHGRSLGLGLTIARHLVEAHGGTLQATSTPGAGSRFTATLPARHGPRSPHGDGPVTRRVTAVPAVATPAVAIPTVATPSR